MAWIAVIEPETADVRLKALFDSVRGPSGEIDNILAVHSLRPHTLGGHMALYKSVLHHSSNTLPKPLRESIGLYVSILNKCQYCIAHHYAALESLIGDASLAGRIYKSLNSGRLETAFGNGALAALRYAATLTLQPSGVNEAMIVAMRDGGLDDAQILEVNQIASYFAYANRMALGLGVRIDGLLGGRSGAAAEMKGTAAIGDGVPSG